MLVGICAVLMVALILFSVFGANSYNPSKHIVLGRYKGLEITVKRPTDTSSSQEVDFDDILNDFNNASGDAYNLDPNIVSADQVKDKLWEMVMNATEVRSYPEKQLVEIKNDFWELVKSAANESNSELYSYILTTYGMDKDQFNEYVEEYAKTLLKQKMTIKAIAEAENLSISHEEYESGIERYSNEYSSQGKDYSREQILDIFQGEDGFKEQLLYEKIVELLESNAVITYQ